MNQVWTFLSLWSDLMNRRPMQCHVKKKVWWQSKTWPVLDKVCFLNFLFFSPYHPLYQYVLPCGPGPKFLHKQSNQRSIFSSLKYHKKFSKTKTKQRMGWESKIHYNVWRLIKDTHSLWVREVWQVSQCEARKRNAVMLKSWEELMTVTRANL